MGKNNAHGGGAIMQIFFLVLLLAFFGTLWVIAKQGQIIMELSHKINMLELGMKGDEAVNAVIFSQKKHKPSSKLKQERKLSRGET